MRHLLDKAFTAEVEARDIVKTRLNQLTQAYPHRWASLNDDQARAVIRINGLLIIEVYPDRFELDGPSLKDAPGAKVYWSSDTGMRREHGFVTVTTLAEVVNLLAKYEQLIPLR